MSGERLAVYTTVYPGAEPYLSAWYQSVLRQIDRNFDLYVSLDSLSAEAVIAAIGYDPQVTFFPQRLEARRPRFARRLWRDSLMITMRWF
jgi:hypothetical protein